MAGFYGNIRNATSNSFKFDRIYSNRTLMDKNANSDGIFGGRYVLVEYDQPVTENFISPISRSYYEVDGVYYLNQPTIEGPTETTIRIKNVERRVNSFKLEPPEEGEMTGDYTKVYHAVPTGTPFDDKETYYTLEIDEESNTQYVKANITEFADGITYYTNNANKIVVINKWTIALEKTQEDYSNDDWGKMSDDEKANTYKVYRDEENNETILGYSKNDVQFFDKPYKLDSDNNPSFKKEVETRRYIQKVSDDRVDWVDVDEEDTYTTNYLIDAANYGKGRGYDSTVWRKVYLENGTVKYLNVADLNSVVPTFAITLDAPTDNPLAPHFDADSTNVYYNIHLQTPWGFRIAHFDNNPDRYQTTYREKEYLENGDIIWGEPEEYDAAIYFNKDGFKRDRSVHDKDGQNFISLEPTGYSSLYPTYHDHSKVNNEGDIKELSVILPAIGNTVAEMWDLMYGNGADKTGANKGKRTTLIHWDDPNDPSPEPEDGQRLRMVADNPNELKPDGVYYTPIGDTAIPETGERQIDTLAGAINSVHDILGMIITPEAGNIEEVEPGVGNNLVRTDYDTDKYVPSAFTDYIYYTVNNDNTCDFFYAGKGIGYEELSAAEKTPNFVGNIEQAEVYDNFIKIPAGRIKDYSLVSPKQYTQSGNSWVIAEEDVARPTIGYYTLPTKLKYAGKLMDNNLDNGKYFTKGTIVDNNITKEAYTPVENIDDKTIDYYSVQPWYLIDPTKDCYFSTLKSKYAEYDEEKDQYVPISNWGADENQNETLWLEKANAGNLYMDGAFNGSPTKADYWVISSIFKIKKVNKTNNKDIIFVDVDQRQISSTASIKAYIQSLATADSGYTYDTNNLWLKGEQEVDPGDDAQGGEQPISYKTQYYPYPLSKLLIDDGTLYEKIDGQYIKSSFNSPCGTAEPVNAANQKVTFYKITAQKATYYEPNKYYTFTSSDKKVKNGMVYATVVETETDADTGEETSIESKGELVNAKDAANSNIIINTAYQSIKSMTLSGTKYSSDETYWIAVDPESGEEPAETAPIIRPTLVAHGVDDFNINNPNGTLYYTDNILYQQLINTNYQLTDSKAGYEFNENNYELYKQRELYIIDTGSFTQEFNIYQRWNIQLVQSQEEFDYFFSASAHPDDPDWKPIVLGKKVNTFVKKDLPGFARNLNTIHGLIIRLNEMLQFGDLKTRDPNTVQGCLNQLHDIFEKFNTLIPGELYGVDKYGKISPVGFNDDNGGESWITLQTHTIDERDADPENGKTLGKTVLEVIHNTNEWADDRVYTPVAQANYDSSKTYYYFADGVYREYKGESWIDGLFEQSTRNPSNHDVFEINITDGKITTIAPTIDDGGHVNGSKTSTITLNQTASKNVVTNIAFNSNTNAIDVTRKDLNEILLGTGTGTLGTLNSPDGNVNITKGDTLAGMITKFVNHINAGASNITLNEYNNYYTNNVNNSMGNDVDNNDNINEAIAKLQWQLNHIANRKLTDLNSSSNALPSGYNPFTGDTVSGAIAATDSLGLGLNKLQAQITNLNTRLNSTNSDIVTNYCGIVRAPEAQVPSSVPDTAYYNADIKSGWIWVDTTNNYIYIKIKNGYKENFTNEIDRNYWELLNAWQ